MPDHIKALFEGQELSNEFKEKANAIFEAVVNETRQETEERVKTELKEEYDNSLNEEIEKLENLSEEYVQNEVLGQIDKYLTMAVNEWQEENKVALETGSKVALAESFLTGLLGIAESHNLDIKQEDFDQVKQVEEQMEELKNELTEIKEKNSELAEENQEFKKQTIVDGLTKELSEAQADKITSVVEGVEFKNEDQYKSAVQSLIESYFPEDGGDKGQEKNTIEEQGLDTVNENQDEYTKNLFSKIL